MIIVSELISILQKWNPKLKVIIGHEGKDIEFYSNGIYEDQGRLIIDTGEKPITLKKLDESE